jgi:hypothetical protein
MTVETILVVIAVTMMFVTIAAVIAWGDKADAQLVTAKLFFAKTSSSQLTGRPYLIAFERKLRRQNVGGVQALMTSQALAPTQRKRCGRRLSK